MKKSALFLFLVAITLFVQAGTITYYPKGSTPDQEQGLTEFFPNAIAKSILIVAHGIGERNPGDLAGCKKSSGWGGWANIKLNADKYGIILIFINASLNYEKGEFQYALKWAKKKYPNLSSSVWVWGHSLGSYGAGRYAFKDTTFASQIAGWIASGSGDFTPYATAVGNNLWQTLSRFDVRCWGVTATNDVVSGTSPKPIRELYAQVTALKGHALKTEFPSTEWPNDYPITAPTGSKVAHNAVLSRLSQAPPYYSKGNIGLITYGVASNTSIKMNVYEFMLSNPRGSIYQEPTLTYTGAKYATDTVVIPPPPVDTVKPAPAPVPTAYFREFINTGDGVYKITYTDGSFVTFRIPISDTLLEQYARPGADGRYYFVVHTKAGIRKIFDKK